MCSIFKRENFKYTPQTSAIYRFTQLFFIITNLPIPSTGNPPQVVTTTKAQSGYELELGGGVREGLGRVRKVRVRKFGLVGKS